MCYIDYTTYTIEQQVHGEIKYVSIIWHNRSLVL